jgi:two-component system, response regulator PdtaR
MGKSVDVPLRILTCESSGEQAKALAEALTRLGYKVAGQAGTAADAIRLAEAHRPDVVLLDIDIAGPDALVAASEIRTNLGIDVIFASTIDNIEVRRRALRVGFVGFLLKPYAAKEIGDVLTQAARRIGRKTRLVYRRQSGSEIWHWCGNCSTWPKTEEFEQANFLPAGAEVCNECWIRNQDGACDRPLR